MRELPDSITSLAFCASNGELAWRRANIEIALIAIRDTQQAVLGGEVWMVNEKTRTWDGGIPQQKDNVPAVWHWETDSRTASESWSDYCNRSFAESLEIVRKMALEVENESQPEVIDSLRFNLTYIDETGK